MGTKAMFHSLTLGNASGAFFSTYLVSSVKTYLKGLSSTLETSKMEQILSNYLLVRIFILMALLPIMSHARCNYSAIFNFGDSTSDTGAIHVIFPYNELAENPPYGKTFFGKPVSRYSDGRLFIDFFAQAIGLPFLSPYLQSVASTFGHGANFAAAGATARDTNSFIVPISLTVQINQFKAFKQKVLASVQAHGPLDHLPSEEAFRSGIYTIDIGVNDFSYAYMKLKLTTAQVKKSFLPNVAMSIVGAVQSLYNEGARTILVSGVQPQGCSPFWLTYFSHSSNDFDKHGCSIYYNDAVLYFNTLLRYQLSSIRKQLKGANIIYVNTYDIIYDFFANPSKYGFKAPTTACCGVGGNYNYNNVIECGSTGTINGSTVKAVSCSDPASYVSWDGAHLTDEANRLLTKQILSGKYFEPSFPLATFCDLQGL